MGDDDWQNIELASRGASLQNNGAATQSEEDAQARTHDPLPNIGGSGNDTQTRSITRGASGCGRSSGDGENSAGTGVSVHSFYHDGHVAAMHGSGVHRAQNTHSSPNTSGDSREDMGEVFTEGLMGVVRVAGVV